MKTFNASMRPGSVLVKVNSTCSFSSSGLDGVEAVLGDDLRPVAGDRAGRELFSAISFVAAGDGCGEGSVAAVVSVVGGLADAFASTVGELTGAGDSVACGLGATCGVSLADAV